MTGTYWEVRRENGEGVNGGKDAHKGDRRQEQRDEEGRQPLGNIVTLNGETLIVGTYRTTLAFFVNADKDFISCL